MLDRLQLARLTILRIRRDQALLNVGIGRGIKSGVFHPERTEQPLLQEFVETHSTDNFHNATRSIDPALAIGPF